MSVLINRCCWIAWVVGTIVIVSCWVDVVSVETGWIGFGIAMAGTLLSRLTNAVSPALSDEWSDSESDFEEPESD